MEENKELLNEGSRLSGTLSYKDFLFADPEFKVGLVNGKISAQNIGNTIKVSKLLAADKNLWQESFQRAFLTIKTIEKEMFDQKLNELKNVITNDIEVYINYYFGNENFSLTPYEVLAKAKNYAKQHSYGGTISWTTEKPLLIKQHQAALAEAVVYKYFEEKLKDANDRRSGLKRALNNMSNQDKDIAKA